MSISWDYFNRYDDEEFKVKKSNRRRKIDKRAQAHEDFMRLNGQGFKSTILPLLAKKSQEAKGKK